MFTIIIFVLQISHMTFSLVLQDNPIIGIQFDSQFEDAPLVQNRIVNYINLTSRNPIKILDPNATLAGIPSGSVVISIGNTSNTKLLISGNELHTLGSEGFIVRSATLQGISLYAVVGNPFISSFSPFPPNSGNSTVTNNGLLYGVYALLEEFGFGFFHPLNATIPYSIIFPDSQLNIVEKPYWETRGFHYHSQHPLDLTNFFNGWGPLGISDEKGWEDTIPYFISFAEWLAANRQNKLEYVLLYAEDWKDFAVSKVRQTRLAKINEISHQFGIRVGADVTIAEIQQHAWHMTSGDRTPQQQQKDIHDVISWLVDANYDFISTESGISEFTNPGCQVMLNLINWANQAANSFGKELYIKAHISINQNCADFVDPRTGNPPLNFNYLPYYSGSTLNIMTHTVQLYTVDDPVANSYGNTNFSDMFNFTMFLAKNKSVVWFPETTYWVSYDINVPLFLPLYGSARIYDLRQIAMQEMKTGVKLRGQMIFDSGWEWGYWFSDVVAARASWNPFMDLSFEDARNKLFSSVTRIFGENSNSIASLLATTCDIEHDILVLGKINGKLPSDIIFHNGISYLEGWDTWADLSRYTGTVVYQPLRMDLESLLNPFNWDYYGTQINPLLTYMAANFSSLSSVYKSLGGKVDGYAKHLFDELVDSMEITSLRASIVSASYDHLWGSQSLDWRNSRFSEGISALSRALTVISLREKMYRSPIEWITSWGSGPTVYTYGYLWTVHSGYFFYRDLLRSKTQTLDTISPCFMNIISPIDVVFGEGLGLNFTESLQELFDYFGWKFIGNCLHAPLQEPHYNMN